MRTGRSGGLTGYRVAGLTPRGYPERRGDRIGTRSSGSRRHDPEYAVGRVAAQDAVGRHDDDVLDAAAGPPRQVHARFGAAGVAHLDGGVVPVCDNFLMSPLPGRGGFAWESRRRRKAEITILRLIIAAWWRAQRADATNFRCRLSACQKAAKTGGMSRSRDEDRGQARGDPRPPATTRSNCPSSSVHLTRPTGWPGGSCPALRMKPSTTPNSNRVSGNLILGWRRRLRNYVNQRRPRPRRRRCRIPPSTSPRSGCLPWPTR